MARRATRPPLFVYMNNRRVGLIQRATSGAVSFQYDEAWCDLDNTIPLSLSLSMPVRRAPYLGDPVLAVLDNLLPDAEAVRRHLAGRVGAAGTDAYSLLEKIGRDCVGALQFVIADEEPPATDHIQGDALNEADICQLLKSLKSFPLGLNDNDGFRISLAGAQEKNALLWHNNQWKRHIGTTPTTHIFKPQIGPVPTQDGTIDLSHSVENEFYCLKLLQAFGVNIPNLSMRNFGDVRALVIERFDRQWTQGGRLLRIPQEDFC